MNKRSLSNCFLVVALVAFVVLAAAPVSAAVTAGDPPVAAYKAIELPRTQNDALWNEVYASWDKRFEGRHCETAIAALTRLEQQNPEDPAVTLWLARAYTFKAWNDKQNRADFKKSRAYALKTLELDPANESVRKVLYADLPLLMDRSGQWKEFDKELAYGPLPERRQLPPFTGSVEWMEGFALWQDRADFDTALKAEKIFEAYADAHPRDGMAQVWVSRACYYLGEYWLSMGEMDKKGVPYFKRGVKYGERALELMPESLEAHYWYVADLSRSIMTLSLMRQARHSSNIVKHLMFCVKEDSLYFFGGPAMLLSGCITSGGSIAEKAMHLVGFNGDMVLHMLEVDEQVYPDCFYLPFLRADLLVVRGEEKEALAIYKRVMESDPDCSPRYSAENRCLVRMSRDAYTRLTK